VGKAGVREAARSCGCGCSSDSDPIVITCLSTARGMVMTGEP
jgi:hypothetical protein